jgi:hypothetical protein
MQPFDGAATLPEALRYHRALETVPNRSGGFSCIQRVEKSEADAGLNLK